MWRHLTVLGAVALCAPVLHAQDAALQACTAVFEGATRNLEVSERLHAVRSAVFSEHCEENGALRRSTSEASAKLGLDKLNLGLGRSGTSARQEMQKFCKQASSDSQAWGSQLRLTNSVAVDALTTFNQCVALAGKGLNVSHQATTTNALTVQFDFNVGRTSVTLRNVRVHPEGLMQCSAVFDRNAAQLAEATTPAAGQTVGTGRMAVGPEMAPVLAAGGFSVECGRQAQEVRDAQGHSLSRFPYATVQVTTSHGPYQVAMPAEDVEGYELASLNRSAILALRADVAQRDRQLRQADEREARLKAAMANAVVTTHWVHQDSAGCGGVRDVERRNRSNARVVEDFARRECAKKKAELKGFSLLKSEGGGTCGDNAYLYSCVRF